MRQPRKIKNTKTTSHFISNDDLYNEIVDFQEKRKTNPEEQISNKLGQMIITLVEGLAHNKQFSTSQNESYMSEMVSAGIFACFKAIPKFDATRVTDEGDKTSAFSFLTTTARFAFYNVIEKEKQFYYTKGGLLLEMIQEHGVHNLLSDESDSILNEEDFLRKTGFDFESVAEMDIKIRDNRKKKQDQQGLERFVDWDETDE